MKRYIVHVQFVAVGVKVTAKNSREAKKKARVKVAKMRPERMIDGHNLFADEIA